MGRQAQGPFTASCKLGRQPSPRGDQGTRSGDSSEVSAGGRGGDVQGPQARALRWRWDPAGAPGGLPYQARMPCSVDTPGLPCGIPGLCTAFKSPTPKFTKLLLAAAAADGAGGGPVG